MSPPNVAAQSSLNSDGNLPLYQGVARRIASLVEIGTFRPGDRVPSVRRFSEELNVSISTVIQAYRRLENDGILEARPQSGYYVKSLKQAPSTEPQMAQEPSVPAEVSNGELAVQLLNSVRDPNLIILGAAIPNRDLLPMEKLDRCLSAAARRARTRGPLYDAPPGCESLRIQIAQRLVEAGCAISPDEIMTTNGCLEAMVLALRATCQPGDTVAIESPAYYGALQALQFLGLKALEIPCQCRTGMSVDALRFALDNHSVKACLVTSNFSNPLGSCMPDESKRDLVHLLAERNIPLIEDDLYGNLFHSGSRPRVAKAFDENGMVLLCSSFSKDLAPSYRVGWICPGKYASKVEQLKTALNVANATIPQMAISDFLANGGYDSHLRKIRRVYAAQTAAFGDAVERYFPEGTRFTQPSGGYVLWVEMPAACDSMKLYESARAKGITTAPGTLFSAVGRYRNYVRLNAARWSPEVERAVAVLGQLAKDLL
jgi:DNA-binding transcriptional MocR family regulator